MVAALRRRSISSSERRRVCLTGESLCGEENLVGESVADAAEEARVGERSLQGAVLLPYRGGEFLRRRGENLDAAAIEIAQSRGAVDEVQGRTLLVGRLRPQE